MKLANTDHYQAVIDHPDFDPIDGRRGYVMDIRTGDTIHHGNIRMMDGKRVVYAKNVKDYIKAQIPNLVDQ